MKNTLTQLVSKFLEKKEYHISYFNIFSTFLYWSWQPLNEQLTGHPNIDGYRWLLSLLSIVLHFLYVYKKINFNVSNIVLNMAVIFQFSWVIYLNNFHIVYVMGFVFILVLQSLTFKNKNYLFSFFGFAFVLTVILGIVAQNNKFLFLYYALTSFILSPLIALLKIKDEEHIHRQKEEIHSLKIGQLNSKIHENMTKLSSSLAHEINTPLTTILGYTDLVKEFERNEKRDKIDFIKFLNKIETQVIKIKDITSVLGLLSSDPKQAVHSSQDFISTEEIEGYICNHISKSFHKSNVNFEFKSDLDENFYKINKGKMFYILNEMFKLFPDHQPKGIKFYIHFEKETIKILTWSSVKLQINDLKTMTAQVIANNYNFNIEEYSNLNSNGIILTKSKENV